ncbi:MAG: Cna B domain-containing [Planctomycetota bacterium]|nr:MAG: Cna B domain-containing [Planctomycetota bacterium]
MNRTPAVRRTRIGAALAVSFALAVSGLSVRAQEQNPAPDAGQVTGSVEGIVSLDVDGDGSHSEGEPVLAGVTVELRDGEGNLVATTTTNASGQYSFQNLGGGAYTVSVPKSTAAGDFNESLASWFSAPSWQQAAQVNGTEGASYNFLFNLNIDQILNDLNPQDPDGNGFSFNGNGNTIGYWKHQLEVAIEGKGNAQVSAATMKGYLAAIEALYLPEPFKFPDGFQSALDILGSESSEALDLLLKQLLGTEFNLVSGRGLAEPWFGLEGVLVAWGEYLAAHSSLFSREFLLKAKDIFDLINNTGSWS